MLGWQRPARRSERLRDSRVHRTYGTKESHKEGRSSNAIYTLLKRLRVGSVAIQVIHEEVWNARQRSLPNGTTQDRQRSTNPQGGLPVRRRTEAWLQDAELINGDTRKKIRSGVVQPCL